MDLILFNAQGAITLFGWDLTIAGSREAALTERKSWSGRYLRLLLGSSNTMCTLDPPIRVAGGGRHHSRSLRRPTPPGAEARLEVHVAHAAAGHLRGAGRSSSALRRWPLRW